MYEANGYRKFLAPEVRQKTYRCSERNRYGPFRSHFRLPLNKVDALTDLFINNEWIKPTKRCSDEGTLYIKAQLHILGALEVLASHTPFRKLQTSTEISTEEHRLFFHVFLDKMCSIQHEHIKYPDTFEDLLPILKRYSTLYLPGCDGSIDVVHLKWSNCPAGDKNRCTGKENYPTLSFEVISDNYPCILGVSSIQFGTRNDQHIVKLDENVDRIKNGWYKDVCWNRFDTNGNVHRSRGVYLICDGGYLRWPCLICPFKHVSCATQKGYFSTNLESVR